ILLLWRTDEARARPLIFFSGRRRHTSSDRDWSSDVCSSDLGLQHPLRAEDAQGVLQAFVTKNPEHKLAPEARYWQARARLAAGRSEERRVGKEGRRLWARDLYRNQGLVNIS